MFAVWVLRRCSGYTRPKESDKLVFAKECRLSYNVPRAYVEVLRLGRCGVSGCYYSRAVDMLLIWCVLSYYILYMVAVLGPIIELGSMN